MFIFASQFLNNTTPNKNKNQNEIQKNTSKIKWRSING